MVLSNDEDELLVGFIYLSTVDKDTKTHYQNLCLYLTICFLGKKMWSRGVTSGQSWGCYFPLRAVFIFPSKAPSTYKAIYLFSIPVLLIGECK